ncbi:deoxyribodipyrimidine photo-lyase [Acetobacter ascendens]|uniref:deoxyribodipyrimidine photo-lyase n=1 Tax=Acetobacter ascendens TaxID=481146 RepID=UPI001D17689E|nr:deoxyribodipyrimidine photo-lyase [Acetobacter ascendens]
MVDAPSPAPVLVLLRDDYRVADNPALHAACATGQPVLCAYVQDTALQDAPITRIADWAQAACAQLAASLHTQGLALFMLSGPTRLAVPALAHAVNATDVFWNRRYDAPGIAVDTDVHASLKQLGVTVHSCTGRLLFEPWAICTQAGQPYRVFTAWWRAARDLPEPPPPLPAPDIRGKDYVPARALNLPDGVRLGRVGTQLPALPPGWTSGEKAAHANLHLFIENALENYETQRDRADATHGTSLLSPYIRVGQISVRQIWHAIRHAADQNPQMATDTEKFLAELRRVVS